MPNSFPALGQLQVAQVTYQTSMGSIASADGAAHGSVGGGPVSFAFSFVASPGAEPDNSWFDQNATEAAISTCLDALATAVAALLNRTVADVQASITVTRQLTLQAAPGSAFTLGTPDQPSVLITAPMTLT